jgi:hypothetical protein
MGGFVITSSAPGHLLDRLRRLSGPNPAGSKLDDVERLHLIFLLGASLDKEEFTPEVHAWIVKFTIEQLEERGMPRAELIALIEGAETELNVVTLADAIAVHPSLRHPYLD